MKTNGKAVLVVVGALAALAAACSGSTAPAQPSWDEDVFPIIQGSCAGCHGQTAGDRAQVLGRYDICAAAPFMAAQIVVPKLLTGASGAGGGLISTYLNPTQQSSRPAMPPPPASVLNDYEDAVIKNWLKLAPEAQCVKRGGNRPPSVRVVDAQNVQDGLQLVLEVTDPDGDVVLGKATSGTNPSAPILASGRQRVIVPGARVGDRVTVVIHDGWIPEALQFDF
jgi:hypothetical protein